MNLASAEEAANIFTSRLGTLLHYAVPVPADMKMSLRQSMPSTKVLLILHLNKTTLFIPSRPTADDMGRLYTFMVST